MAMTADLMMMMIIIMMMCCSQTAHSEMAEFSPAICKAMLTNLGHQQHKIRISALQVSAAASASQACPEPCMCTCGP